jgi:hypothetical protein
VFGRSTLKSHSRHESGDIGDINVIVLLEPQTWALYLRVIHNLLWRR